jgi:16S rRNA (cytidine1402-2'-O)-methyltransferase
MTLYLVATPIGNLADFTFRAVETLKSCDYLLCEDTRHSGILLKHYGIKKTLRSFHKFNERKMEEAVIADLKAGKIIGLLSDAGTPGIADPGALLIQRCHEEKIAISALPGPCSALLGLILSGLDTTRFQFFGFLPKDNALKGVLQELLDYPFTTICYETPHRICKTLEHLLKLDPNREIAIARELTKTFEEILKGSVHKLHQHFKDHPPKGEFVLILSGKPPSAPSLVSLEEIKKLQKEFHLSAKQAIKLLTQLKKIPKKGIYKALLHN